MAFKPENRLEEALVAAVGDPAAAPDFYRLLLESSLMVLGTAEGHEFSHDSFSLSPNTRLNLVPGFKDGQRYLPVFTSLTRMQDYVKQDSKYLSLNGRILMEVTRGAPLILNPKSDFGREFSPAEIAQLLDPAPQGEAKMVIGEADFPVPL
ncbi:MAG TPA: SseB family protein, partial [Rhizomicrobium sp.]